MAIISGNQNVEVAHVVTTNPSRNGDNRFSRSEVGAARSRFDPARTVIATAPAAIHAGGSASVGSSGENVQRRKTIVMTITYRTKPRPNAPRATKAPRRGPTRGGR